jgi:hypothetical protein
MKVIRKDVVKPFDVDRTLVFWVPIGQEPPKNALEVDYYGDKVFVWSGNGFQWAENVIRALGFKDTDDILIMSKFSGYIDDLPISEWAGNRIYIKPHSNPYSENDI